MLVYNFRFLLLLFAFIKMELSTKISKNVRTWFQKFATQWRRSFQPHNLYIFLISITRRVDPAMTVCPILGILSQYDDETF